MITLKTFSIFKEMKHELLLLLHEHMTLDDRVQHAVMLSGGKTPLGIYRELSRNPFPISHRLHLLLSDERHVPVTSPESNYGTMLPMIKALCIDEAQIFRVHTELPHDEAAYLYNKQLFSLIADGGRITLGLLGLGTDGHTASLFSYDDVKSGEGKYAIATVKQPDSSRISVTSYFLQKVERLVFIVTGHDKASIIDRLMKTPEETPAGLAVANHENVQVWYSPEI